MRGRDHRAVLAISLGVLERMAVKIEGDASTLKDLENVIWIELVKRREKNRGSRKACKSTEYKASNSGYHPEAFWARVIGV